MLKTHCEKAQIPQGVYYPYSLGVALRKDADTGTVYVCQEEIKLLLTQKPKIKIMNKVERMKSLIRQKWASQLVVGHYKSRDRRHVAHRLDYYLFREGTSLKKIIMNSIWWAASDEHYDWEPIYQEASVEPLRG